MKFSNPSTNLHTHANILTLILTLTLNLVDNCMKEGDCTELWPMSLISPKEKEGVMQEKSSGVGKDTTTHGY